MYNFAAVDPFITILGKQDKTFMWSLNIVMNISYFDKTPLKRGGALFLCRTFFNLFVRILEIML